MTRSRRVRLAHASATTALHLFGVPAQARPKGTVGIGDRPDIQGRVLPAFVILPARRKTG